MKAPKACKPMGMKWVYDNMHFIDELTRLLMQIKALIIPFVYMLLYIKYISIILCNLMLSSKNTSIYG